MTTQQDGLAPQERVAQAQVIIRNYCRRQISWSDLIAVAEELGLYAHGLVYWEQEEGGALSDKLKITLTDLQYIAFAAALTANRIAIEARPKA